MSKFDKRIVTHKSGNNAPHHDEWTFSNGFIISSGTYNRSVAFLNKLAKQAKKDWPDLKDEDIEAFVITKSSYNQGFAGVRFPLPANAKKRGYSQSNRLDFSHS